MSARLDWCKTQLWWDSAAAMMSAGMAVEIHVPHTLPDLADLSIDEDGIAVVRIKNTTTLGSLRVYSCSSETHWHVFSAIHHTNGGMSKIDNLHRVFESVGAAVARGAEAMQVGHRAVVSGIASISDMLDDISGPGPENEDDWS